MRWVLAVALLVVVGQARAASLVYTVPSLGALRYVVPDPDGDTIRYECSGGPWTAPVTVAYLYGAPVTGGGFAPVDSHSVLGMEGLADSFPAPWPGHFYVRTRNGPGPMGLSCPSNVAYIPPGDLTGVPAEEVDADPVFLCRLFDVRSRLVGILRGAVWYQIRREGWRLTRARMRDGVVRGRLASGIYFLQGVRVGGARVSHKVVIVR